MAKNVIIPNGYYIHSEKYKLYPTEEQKIYLEKCILISRMVYNWALEQEYKQYELFKIGEAEYGFLNRNELERLFTEYRNMPENKFLFEIPHITERLAIWQMYRSYIRYFEGLSKIPKFKSKKKETTSSFHTRSDRMFFINNKVRIEGLPKDDMIELKFDTHWTRSTSPKVYNPTITRDIFGNYWLSFGYIRQKENIFKDKNIPPLNRAIGIDLNFKKRFQLSDGTYYMAPNIEKYVNRFSKLSRICSRDIKRRIKWERANPNMEFAASNRSKKRLYKKRKVLRKIANIAENFIQTTTKRIIEKRPSAIVMEKLNITKMRKTKYIWNRIFTYHSNFYRCRYVMELKCKKYNIPFILAPVDFRSSQICSNCGHIQDIGSSKIYRCKCCGIVIDRDLNAAINLENLAYQDVNTYKVA